LDAADENKYVRVVQIETNAVGSDSANSAASGQIANAPSFTGLLDDYPSAAAAYSLRLLRAAYSGDAIRVRRASDNAELNIGFVANELDTAALTTFASGTTATIVIWYDQSGNNRDLIQSTAIRQPVIYQSGSVILEGSKPSVRFTGNDVNPTFFDYGSTQFLNDANILCVTKNFNTAIGGIFSVQNDTAAAKGMQLWNFNNNYTVWNSGGPSRLDTNNALGLFASIQFGRNTSAASYTLVNGTLQSKTTTTEKTLNPYYIGTITSSQYPYNGNISEFIVYNKNMYADINGIETNVNDYYGIY